MHTVAASERDATHIYEQGPPGQGNRLFVQNCSAAQSRVAIELTPPGGGETLEEISRVIAPRGCAIVELPALKNAGDLIGLSVRASQVQRSYFTVFDGDGARVSADHI